MKVNRYASAGQATHFIPLVAAILIASLTACRRDSAETSSLSGTTTDSGRASASVTSQSKKVNLEHPVIRIETNQGIIAIRLDAVSAPATVRNFLNYVNEGFYNNTIVHFVDADKMIVAGGYAADRKPKPTGRAIRNEAHNGLKNRRGTIAMARDQSLIDSATSQFFINLTDAPQRDHKGDSAADYGYCVFGEITEGLDVAQRISKSSTADLGSDLAQTPDPPVVITSVRVVR